MILRATIVTSALLLGAVSTATPCKAQEGDEPRYPENGPPSDPAFFPIAVWWQQANAVGHTGSHRILAAAAASAHINIMLGQGADWPESFGADQGEFEEIKRNGLYLIGGINVPWRSNTSETSVASILALARSIHALDRLIGYNAGDEPQCVPSSGQVAMTAVPGVIEGIRSFDPTRLVAFNETAWMLQPQWQTHPPNCLSREQAALQATPVASFDYYPLTNPYIATELGVAGTDYKSIPNDSLYLQGLAVQAMGHFAARHQPLWAYIEAGGDNFGFSEAHNSFEATVTAGSATLVSTGSTGFSSTWIGLQVSGGNIPSGTQIVGVTDAAHAVMSQAATGSSVGDAVTVTGGTEADCVARENLCVVNGNEYRPTPDQVSAEVWMSLINGANGIEYFCHDTKSYSFCLGDTAAAGVAAKIAYENISYINQEVLLFAPMLNAKTVGQCSMQSLGYTSGDLKTADSCSDGVLTMKTSRTAVPGAALLKSHKGSLYLFAQSNRRSKSGAVFSFTIPSMAGRQAAIVFDSNSHYDPSHTNVGAKFKINASGSFSDSLGQYDDYQVKIYRLN